MIIGFAIFSKTQFISSGYVYYDYLGRSTGVVPIRTGNSSFSIDRWGDYTASHTDPLAPGRFWTLQTHTSGNRWAAVWTMIDPYPRRRSVGK